MKKERKQASLFDALLCLGFLVTVLVTSLVFLKEYEISAHIPLLVGGIFTAGIAIFKLGFTWKELEEGILSTINTTMPSILILLIVGVLIGTWIISGIVPSMIYYGLNILSPSIFLVATTIICAIVSVATGSSWTTAGTIGIALLGIGSALNIPSPIIAGAIISGAYFGDKMSPLSDTTNLAPAMAGTNLFDHIKHMLYTTTPALVISLVLYGIIGFKYAGSNIDNSQIVQIQNALMSNYNTLSPLLLLVPVLVIALVILKVPAIPFGLIFATIFTAIGTNLAVADQYLAIVIPGSMYKDAFKKQGLDAKNLSRALEDSATITSSLIPWNTCGAYMSATLGVGCFAFLPFAFFNLLCPIISLIYGATGITIEKIKDDENAEIVV